MQSTPKTQEADKFEPYPICVRCKEPVIANRDRYEVFEKMHYLCFHLEFEHGSYGDFDPDEFCFVPGCHWAPVGYTGSYDEKLAILDRPPGPHMRFPEGFKERLLEERERLRSYNRRSIEGKEN